jgi:sulfate permease, SulP family
MTRGCALSRQEFVPKLFSVLAAGIGREQLRKDLIAGVIVGIIALPLAIAFAIASGVGPKEGIITAVVGGFVISFLGGSRVQIGGPTGAFIVIVYAIIARHGLDGLMTATFMAGIILIAMGVLKMGSLLKYIPQTLIIGFTSAIALIIFTTQINDLLGLRIADLPSGFIARWGAYLSSLRALDPASCALGGATIALVTLMPRFKPAIPWVFVAICVTSLAAWMLGLPVETIGSRFGEISSALPEFKLVALDLPSLQALFVPAVSIAILAALESLLSAVVADGMIGGRHRSNMELVAQGAANVLLPLLGGIPVTGAIARTAANIKNGGRTPIAGIMHALFLLLIYIFAMPVVAYVPMATLAGVLVVVAWQMADVKVFANSLRMNIYESMVLLTTFFITVLIDLTVAIPVGFVLATILFMKRMSDSIEIAPLMSSKQDGDSLFSSELGSYSKCISIFELNGPMFFGSAHNFATIVDRSDHSVRCVILRFRYVPIIDSSAIHRLRMVVHELRKKGCEVLISGAKENIARVLTAAGIVDERRVFSEIHAALAYAERELAHVNE